MSDSNKPSSSSKPRAQVAYEGDDEFSVMGKPKAAKVDLAPPDKQPAARAKPEPPPARKRGVWQFMRKMFGK